MSLQNIDEIINLFDQDLMLLIHLRDLELEPIIPNEFLIDICLTFRQMPQKMTRLAMETSVTTVTPAMIDSGSSIGPHPAISNLIFNGMNKGSDLDLGLHLRNQ